MDEEPSSSKDAEAYSPGDSMSDVSLDGSEFIVSPPDTDIDFEPDFSDIDLDYVPYSSDSENEPAAEPDVHEHAMDDSDSSVVAEPDVAEEETNASSSTPIACNIAENVGEKKKLVKLPEKVSRKRKRLPETWKKIKAAKLREQGQAYTSYKGELMPPKVPNTSVLCSEKCRFKCSSHFNNQERQLLMDGYYQQDVNGKNTILFKSIKRTEVARPKTGGKHKSGSFKYLIGKNGEDIRVCKKAFCSLYGIGVRKVSLIRDQIGACLSGPPLDRRGKHADRPNKIPPDVRDKIKEHIGKFPAEESHYSRNKNPQKKYLSPLLNITKMHQMYLQEVEAGGLPEAYKVKYSWYTKIFNEFNYFFGYPQRETCASCDSGEGDLEHKEEASYATAQMKADREKGRAGILAYVTVDLQQPMPLPKISTGKAFYARHLWFYNLGVHYINRRETANFFNWSEHEANRGSLEVGSSLLKFFQTAGKLDEVTIWSDSCGGQNKNFSLIALYQYLVLTGQVQAINHKFPVVGHADFDSDRDFGRIEKNLRKNDTIVLPDQYRKIITESGKNNVVFDMANNFYDFDELSTMLKLVNRKENAAKSNVRRDGIRWIRVEKWGCYLYKETLDPNTPFHEVNIKKKLTDQPPSEVSWKKIVGAHGSVSEEKKNDVRSLMAYLQPVDRAFYADIIEELQ